MVDLQEVAERILTSRSLEEKLLYSPALDEVDPTPRNSSRLILPDQPGRPKELEIGPKGIKSEFPSIHQLEKDHERGKLLHFLCNHELLATELMALAILKFPDAPAEFRLGLYETLREEQAHTLMYLRRMRECGIEFGELPVNDYFWRMIAPMQTPMDFVARLSLTFEQANLDFSKHYAQLFRQVGDAPTAAVLEKIYRDEIGHVGHGLKWFRQWKDPNDSDWTAYQKLLPSPLTPARAKGVAPFNEEGRHAAGLDPDFIQHLRVWASSRGRTPLVHWMNPLAEAEVAAHVAQQAYHPKIAEAALDNDLKILPWAWSRRDDIVLISQKPSISHLERLLAAGFTLPEFASIEEIRDRKLGGIKAWAWTPDAFHTLASLAPQVSKNSPWPLPSPPAPEHFSQLGGIRLLQRLQQADPELTPITGQVASSLPEVEAIIDLQLSAHWVLKAPWSFAGRGICRIDLTDLRWRAWAENTLRRQGFLIVEPWLEKVAEFSALYDRDHLGYVRFLGFTHLLTGNTGRYLGTLIAPKWASHFPPEIAAFLMRQAKVMPYYQEQIPALLTEQLPAAYHGALSIDAAIFTHIDGSLRLKPVIELNLRHSMGRVAWELHQKSDPRCKGLFRIYRIEEIQRLGHPDFPSWIQHQSPPKTNEQGQMCSGLLPINDPSQASHFLACWNLND